MTKHWINWKPVQQKNVRGEDEIGRFPEYVDKCYRGTLLSNILKMEKKSPLSLEKAALLGSREWSEAFRSCRMGPRPGEHYWYLASFVEWISGLGYHIELTGDEFEPYATSAWSH